MKRVIVRLLAVCAVLLLFLPTTLSAKSPQPYTPEIHIITPGDADNPTIGDSEDEGDLDDLVGWKREWKDDGGNRVSGRHAIRAVKVWWQYYLLVRLLY